MYRERMIGYYPQVIKAIKEFQAIIDAEAPEYENLSIARNKLIEDAYLTTMNEERITQWENLLGIRPLENSSVNDRRDTIVARVRGQGKLNTEMINAIVKTFTGGTAKSWIKDSVLYVEITPPPNDKSFQFPNVVQELSRKVPAHLGISVQRNYNTWGEINNAYPTWGDVNSIFTSWSDVVLISNAKYFPVDYIESTGSQYIDTGYVANNNTRVVMDFELMGSGSLVQALYGTRGTSTTQCFVFLWTGSTYRVYYNNQYNDIGNKEATGRRTVDQNKNVTLFDSESREYTNESFTSPAALHLLASMNGNKVTWNATARVYSCKIYDNDRLVRDFIPCRNVSGEIGLWDLVEDKFYGNSGTNTFLSNLA